MLTLVKTQEDMENPDGIIRFVFFLSNINF
jgi:hypothetical protein